MALRGHVKQAHCPTQKSIPPRSEARRVGPVLRPAAPPLVCVERCAGSTPAAPVIARAWRSRAGDRLPADGSVTLETPEWSAWRLHPEGLGGTGYLASILKEE